MTRIFDDYGLRLTRLDAARELYGCDVVPREEEERFRNWWVDQPRTPTRYCPRVGMIFNGRDYLHYRRRFDSGCSPECAARAFKSLIPLTQLTPDVLERLRVAVPHRLWLAHPALLPAPQRLAFTMRFQSRNP